MWYNGIMTNNPIVPNPEYTGQIINGRLVGDKHRVNGYWVYDWECVVHGTKSVKPMRIKNMLARKGPRCCYNQKQENNAGWKGYNTLSLTKFNGIRESAKSRGHEFDLNMEHLWHSWDLQGRKCAYTARSLPDINKASLDRIDSSKGYTLGNVEWVHKDVNLAKQRLDRVEFVKMCMQVAFWAQDRVEHLDKNSVLREGLDWLTN